MYKFNFKINSLILFSLGLLLGGCANYSGPEYYQNPTGNQNQLAHLKTSSSGLGIGKSLLQMPNYQAGVAKIDNRKISPLSGTILLNPGGHQITIGCEVIGSSVEKSGYKTVHLNAQAGHTYQVGANFPTGYNYTTRACDSAYIKDITGSY